MLFEDYVALCDLEDGYEDLLDVSLNDEVFRVARDLHVVLR